MTMNGSIGTLLIILSVVLAFCGLANLFLCADDMATLLFSFGLASFFCGTCMVED